MYQVNAYRQYVGYDDDTDDVDNDDLMMRQYVDLIHLSMVNDCKYDL